MLADIILIVLLTSFTTSSCSQTEETSKPRHKPPPLHIPRNTNPSIFTFSPSSTSSYSPSPAPFTPSFLNSLTDPHNSTPRSPNQVTSRAQLFQPQTTTPRISWRQRSVTSASSNSRQTTPSTPSTYSFRHRSLSSISSSSKRSRTPSREHQRCCKELVNNVHSFNRAEKAALERCSWEDKAVVERGEHWACHCRRFWLFEYL